MIYDIKHKDCIIEFNGDYWHANPKIYDNDDLIRGTKAEDIWKRDALKISIAESHGFRTFVVWENDYINNKEKIIKDVVEWIQNIQELNQ